jgi:hypothetical protein
MRRSLLLIVVVASALGAAAAQQAPAPPLDAQQVCTKEFGEQFKLSPKFAPLKGDLDGDGQEDLVMVATAKNPLSGELDFHYRAIDPYDGYFGWGNVKDTIQFTATNAGTALYVLVIHNWRAPNSLEVGRLAVNKKKKIAVDTIHAVELGGLGSDVYWDGKKYKWEPSYIGQN